MNRPERPETPGTPEAPETPDTPDEQAAEGFDIDFGVTLTTDYIDEGITQTDHGPAVQPYAEATYDILYAGFWASNLDYDDPAEADATVEFSAGVRPVIGDVEFDLGVEYNVYTQEAEDTDFLEIEASAEYDWNDTVTLGIGVEHAPNPDRDGFSETEIEGEIEIELPRDFEVYGTLGYDFYEDPASIDSAYWDAGFSYTLPRDFEVSGTLGYNRANDPEEFDYTYWDVGVSYTLDEKILKERVTLDLRYHDTDLSARECKTNTGRGDWCGAAIVGSVTIAASLSDLRERLE